MLVVYNMNIFETSNISGLLKRILLLISILLLSDYVQLLLSNPALIELRDWYIRNGKYIGYTIEFIRLLIITLFIRSCLQVVNKFYIKH